MIYKFKSKAGGDILMLGPNGDALLRAIGRDPAAKGILEPPAIAAIEQAVAVDEAARREAESEAVAQGRTLPPRDGVSMRQRMWPMVDLLKRSAVEEVPVVWGG